MFTDRIWWITGASSGIGEALARALSAQGARLILSGRNTGALEALRASLAQDCLVLPFEATDFPALEGIAQQAWDWAGRVDGLVNNAGISQRSFATETVFEVYRRITDVDLMAPIALTQQLLPRMVAAGGGQLVAISSIAGIIGPPLRSAYSAAKAGLIAYHDSIRAETAHLGVRVLVVAPGSVRTQVSRNALDGNARPRGFSHSAIDNGMEPADVSAHILDALRAGQRELILARGAEADLASLRRSDPGRLFDIMQGLVADGHARPSGVRPPS